MTKRRRPDGRVMPCEKLAWVRKEARKRGLEFDLTLEYYEELYERACVYCDKPSYGGLDRINTRRGYVKDNVQPCCEICNKAKGVLTEPEFFRHMVRLVLHSCSALLALTLVTTETSCDGCRLRS